MIKQHNEEKVCKMQDPEGREWGSEKGGEFTEMSGFGRVK